VQVAEIAFDGNRAVPADRLRGLLQTRPDGLLRSGYFQEEILQRDMRVLLAFYRSQGMGEARIGPPEVSFSGDRRRARIRIPIEEGAVARVGTIAIQGATAVPADAIRTALPVQPGTAWSEALGEEIRRAVSTLYAAKGYTAAEVVLQQQARDGLVDLTLGIREGEVTRVGRLLVSGLVRTREHVVQREFPLDPGDAFDPEALVKTEQRLADLGIFERIELTPLRPPPTPFTDVAVRVQEAKAWRVDLGVGYSTDDGPRASVELGHDNLFGTARRASLRQKISRIEDRTDLTYRQPWTLGTRWALTGNLFRERRDEIGFDVERVGGAAEVQRDLLAQPRQKLLAALRYQVHWVERSDVDPALIEERVEPGGQVVASLRPSLTWDRRNDPLNPTRGSLHFLALEGAGVPLGSQVNFLKMEAATTWLFDAVGPTVLALSGRLGLARALGGSKDLPIEDRFFAGGESSIRGYGRNRVGPLDEADHPRGGNARVLLNAEWRFPIWKVIAGALFVDTGTVESEIGDLRPSKFKTGVGGGLRLVTPVGPLRFDVGYGLNPVRGDDDRLAFYFSVGYPF
jgi:outer membrane protein insertion porin family